MHCKIIALAIIFLWLPSWANPHQQQTLVTTCVQDLQQKVAFSLYGNRFLGFDSDETPLYSFILEKTIDDFCAAATTNGLDQKKILVILKNKIDKKVSYYQSKILHSRDNKQLILGTGLTIVTAAIVYASYVLLTWERLSREKEFNRTCALLAAQGITIFEPKGLFDHFHSKRVTAFSDYSGGDLKFTAPPWNMSKKIFNTLVFSEGQKLVGPKDILPANMGIWLPGTLFWLIQAFPALKDGIHPQYKKQYEAWCCIAQKIDSKLQTL
jgi:hypothetical protein